MNPQIANLYAIASKAERLVIGLMSGTSLDGLDVALCRIGGYGTDTKLKLVQFETVDYDPAFKAEIQSVFAKKQVDLEKLTLLHPWVALRHAQIVNDCLNRWGVAASDVDFIASHGQTIYHAPKSLHKQPGFGNATLQIGDGDHLAVATGIITLSDFRQKNIAAGGEGAPLAGYGDQLIFSKKGEDRILLNIGGIANFTYLPGTNQNEHLFCSDTGPGNTLMDACTRQQFPGQYFDRNADIARKGIVSEPLLAALKANDFFDAPFPKTTGPELFNLAYLEAAQAKSDTGSLPAEDVMATLCRFSADTIVSAMKHCFGEKKNLNVYSSGGGMHNPLLMQHIKEQLPELDFSTTNALEIDPDAKEAVLFALLANECICGNAYETKKNNPDLPGVQMGKISLPE